MKILRKVLSLALMIASPLIAGMAFIEYAKVKLMGEAPSYPFGKALMHKLQVKDISYLSNYQNEMLSIGVVFLVISVIAYISMMIRALINLIWLAVVLFIGFYVYQLLGK
jgi:hypothetical protein